jgi:hypothetical protein
MDDAGNASSRPPALLIAIAVAYVGLEVVTLFVEREPTVAVRLGISILLFYIVLRGSRVAACFLAACCVGAALISVYGVIAFPAPAAIGFALGGIVCLAIAFYVVFNRRVRAFQAQRSKN